MRVGRRHLTVAGDDECFGDERPDVVSGLSRLRNVHAFERRVIAHDIGRVAVRRLPENVTLGETDRADQAIRRFDERQTLHGCTATAATGRGGSALHR